MNSKPKYSTLVRALSNLRREADSAIRGCSPAEVRDSYAELYAAARAAEKLLNRLRASPPNDEAQRRRAKDSMKTRKTRSRRSLQRMVGRQTKTPTKVKMTKKQARKLIMAYIQDPVGPKTCDNLCTVLDAIDPQPEEGQYTPEEVMDFVAESDLDDE